MGDRPYTIKTKEEAKAFFLTKEVQISKN